MWTILNLFSSSELIPKLAKAEPSSASTVFTTQWNCDALMAAGRKISARVANRSSELTCGEVTAPEANHC